MAKLGAELAKTTTEEGEPIQEFTASDSITSSKPGLAKGAAGQRTRSRHRSQKHLTHAPRKTGYQDRLRRWAPWLAFLGGFLFDIVTLGREVNPINLIVLSGYATGCWVALWLMTRELKGRARKGTLIFFQFCLGSIFSAMVVLYFKSAGQFLSLLVVLALFGAMIWNETYKKKDSQRELVWSIYGLSLVMFFNFLIPHLLRSVSSIWFYISTALALLVLTGLRALARMPWKTLRGPIIAAALLVLCYVAGWIPPVPLVLENSLVGTDFKKQDGEYRCMVQTPTLLQRLGLAPQSVHRRGDEPVFVLSAVSAPRGAEVKLEHRWYRQDQDVWTKTDTIPITMIGGRKAGWRFWTRKRHLVPGLWRVETALQDGAILGYEVFEIRPFDSIEERQERSEEFQAL